MDPMRNEYSPYGRRKFLQRRRLTESPATWRGRAGDMEVSLCHGGIPGTPRIQLSWMTHPVVMVTHPVPPRHPMTESSTTMYIPGTYPSVQQPWWTLVMIFNVLWNGKIIDFWGPAAPHVFQRMVHHSPQNGWYLPTLLCSYFLWGTSFFSRAKNCPGTSLGLHPPSSRRERSRWSFRNWSRIRRRKMPAWSPSLARNSMSAVLGICASHGGDRNIFFLFSWFQNGQKDYIVTVELPWKIHFHKSGFEARFQPITQSHSNWLLVPPIVVFLWRFPIPSSGGCNARSAGWPDGRDAWPLRGPFSEEQAHAGNPKVEPLRPDP